MVLVRVFLYKGEWGIGDRKRKGCVGEKSRSIKLFKVKEENGV